MLAKTNNFSFAPSSRSPDRSIAGSATKLLTPKITTAISAAQDAGRTLTSGWQFVTGLNDALGRGLDRQMIAPIAVLRFLGLPTTACCQGHSRQDGRRALPFPWIDFAGPRENGQLLLSALTEWTIVQRGQGRQRSYRLNPRSIIAIDDQRFDNYPYYYWQPARQQLTDFAVEVSQVMMSRDKAAAKLIEAANKAA